MRSFYESVKQSAPPLAVADFVALPTTLWCPAAPGFQASIGMTCRNLGLRGFSVAQNQPEAQSPRVEPANLVLRALTQAPAQLHALNWQPFREGVDIWKLHEGSEGSAAALLRYHAGARVPRHEHPGTEYLLILEGSQTDDRGAYHRGDFIINFTGTSHRVASSDGCIVLAVWTQPVRFLEEQA
jgi:predicted ChrR family anti-sigma factor